MILRSSATESLGTSIPSLIEGRLYKGWEWDLAWISQGGKDLDRMKGMRESVA